MDQKIYVSNDTTAAKFIGGKLVQPGEGREFDRSDLPGEHLPGGADAGVEAGAANRAPTRADEVMAFYEGANAAQLIAAVLEYSLEDAELLESIEQDRKPPRTTVLAAVAARRLALADSSLGGNGGDQKTPAGDGEQT